MNRKFLLRLFREQSYGRQAIDSIVLENKFQTEVKIANSRMRHPNLAFASLGPVRFALILALLMASSITGLTQDKESIDPYSKPRTRLIESVLKPGGIKNAAVLDAIIATPRHEFVPLALRDQAYLDRSLPIGEAQTISSPFIVALMTEVLQPQPTDKVLEIGTGSGYQAAVLSSLVSQVYTIEIVEDLAAATAKLLERLGYKNIFTKAGDGYQGWQEHAPFDKIIVTCSPDKPPQPLIDQLKEGGLMVIPVGSRYQQLLQAFRKEDNRLVPVYARPTLFVPMTGKVADLRNDAVDQTHPAIVNGDFELVAEGDYIPNWYYEFGAKLAQDSHAPSGKQVVTFTAHENGGPSNLLQGLPMDGRVISKIQLSGFVTTSNVKLGSHFEEQPFIVIQFLDENRNRIGYNWLGPFTGDHPWHKSESTFPIPLDSREVIVLIGLFGTTGSVSFDDIHIKVVESREPVK